MAEGPDKMVPQDTDWTRFRRMLRILLKLAFGYSKLGYLLLKLKTLELIIAADDWVTGRNKGDPPTIKTVRQLNFEESQARNKPD